MEEKKKLTLEKESATYKMIIPKEVEEKIRFVCNRINTVEWSGALFYTYTGNFEDKDLTITCRDFFVMDIGNATYTEFDISPDVIAYMTENPELLDCQIGLIHSHNNMSTFFSSTDTNTLLEEGTDRNIFVSLIVNNAGTYTAGITRRIKEKATVNANLTYEFFGEGPKEVQDNYIAENEYIVWYQMLIDKQGTNDFTLINNRLDEIEKAKKEAQKPKYTTGFNNYGNYGNYGGSKWGDDSFEDTDDDYYNYPSYNLPNNYKKEDKYEQKKLKFENDTKPHKKEVSTTEVLDLYNKETIDYIMLQLICGSIAIGKASKIDPHKWVKTMTSVFDKRFGVGAQGFSVFKMWADSFIEILMLNTAPDNEKYTLDVDYEEEEATSELALQVIDKLEQLPNNKYIEAFIDILNKYL